MTDRTHLRALALLSCLVALIFGDIQRTPDLAIYFLGGLAYIASFFADGSKA